MTEQEALDVINDAVRAGLVFLDERVNGDYVARLSQRMQSKQFSIGSCRTCALATATEQYYDDACEELSIGREDQARMGFAAWDGTPLHEAVFAFSDFRDLSGTARAEWRALTLAWEWHIAARQAGVEV